MHLNRLKGVCTCISFQRSLNTKVHQKDVFGSLSRSGGKVLAIQSVERFAPEDSDGYDKEEFDLEPRKNAFYYKYEITKYARQGSLGLKKALELFSTMKSKDRLTPTVHNFSALIYGCAKAGYTKRAFDLYEESQKYLEKPTKSTVTCLLTACSESPFPEYGLKRLDWFIKHMKIDHQYKFNDVQYRAAIKAYGKLGQLGEASKLVNEMIENGLTPDVHTFNMLFIGCASDKEQGCTLALRVFKTMRIYNIKPDAITYSQILRCIRDCDVGSASYFKQALSDLPAINNFDNKSRFKKANYGMPRGRFDSFELLPNIADMGSSISSALQPQTNIQQTPLRLKPLGLLTEPPNLLSDDHLELVHHIEAIDVDKLRNAQGRLALFGGMRGFLEKMVEDRCEPTKKTFTLLLRCLKHTWYQQVEFLKLAEEYSIERDLLFWDQIIRHVCRNSNDTRKYNHAFYLIEEMHRNNIRPAISTFESMSFMCDSLALAEKFIADVERCGFAVSDLMIFNFFLVAQRRLDFEYLCGLISISKQRKFRPTKSLIENLEATILKSEEGQSQTTDSDLFRAELVDWLKNVELREEDHPWQQFHVEPFSKKRGFSNFVQSFKALEKAKHDAIERGGEFGNLMEIADRDQHKI